ncbi:hypothetical protein EMCRGX_G025118 [Ephydatia muelleri]|eukprot:Em0015g1272a
MSTEESKWWWSALSAAKEKSVLAINATRRDLAEFVSVLQNDTASAISSVGTNLKGLVHPPIEQANPSVSSTSRSMHDAVPQTSGVGYDRVAARLYAIQNDPATYLNVSAGEEPTFCRWKETFDIQDHQTEISQLLVSAPHVRALHSQLVPARISYELFWQHYWYHTSRVKQEEEKRAQLVARVATKDEEWLWDDEPDNAVVDVCHTQENLHEHRSESSESFVCVVDDGNGSNPSEQTSSADPPHMRPVCLDITTTHQAPLRPHQPPVQEEPDREEKDLVDNCSPQHSQNSDSDWERWDD